MRLYNSVRNSSVGILKYTIMTIMKFAIRIILIRFLGAKYLGINGLFTSILSMLSLAELGFGSAIIFSMYKPAAEKNFVLLSELMALYKKIYLIIAIIVAVVGLAITPMVKFFIKDPAELNDLGMNINLVYIIFLTNTVCSYLLSYKRSLLYVNQSNYIEDLCGSGIQLLLGVAQILLMVFTRNYLFYIICFPIFTLLENVVINLITKKKFPLDKPKNKLPKEEMAIIKKNVYALVFHKVSGIIVFATDNLLIAKFVGLETLGRYSNYMLIVTTLSALITMTYYPMGGSIGNSIAIESKQKNYKDFKCLNYVNFSMLAIACACMISITELFIEVCFGSNLLLAQPVFILILMSFVLSRSRDVVNMYKEKAGLFYNDRYKPIFESLINLGASILIGSFYGIYGIIIGTMISSLFVAIPTEAYVLHKHAFNVNPAKYLLTYFSYIAWIAIISIVAHFSTMFIIGNSISILIVKAVVSLLIAVVMIIATSFWKPEFKRIVSYAQLITKKIFRKKNVR